LRADRDCLLAQVAPFMAQLQRLELMNVMLSVSFDCPIFDSRVTDASIARVPHAAVRAPIPSRNARRCSLIACAYSQTVCPCRP
jgi:hypothetical protein